MKRFTFVVNEVHTHNQREVGNHAPTDDVVTVEGTTEEFARSSARAELGKRTPGVQKFQPGVLVKVEDLPPAADSAPFRFLASQVKVWPFEVKPEEGEDAIEDGCLRLRLQFQPMNPAQHDMLVERLNDCTARVVKVAAEQNKPLSVDIEIVTTAPALKSAPKVPRPAPDTKATA
jgi:hypothetical protein